MGNFILSRVAVALLSALATAFAGYLASEYPSVLIDVCKGVV